MKIPGSSFQTIQDKAMAQSTVWRGYIVHMVKGKGLLLISCAAAFFAILFLSRQFFASSSSKPKPRPKKAIKPIMGEIRLVPRMVGYLGDDNHHDFHSTLQLANGEPLRTSPTDYYCLAQVKLSGKENYQSIELPSSLFSQCRSEGGDEVSFIRSSNLYQLKAVSFSSGEEAISFDEELSNIKTTLELSKRGYEYEKDIPKPHIKWYNGSPPVYLSPNSKRIRLGSEIEGAVSLDILKELRGLRSMPSISEVGRRVAIKGDREYHILGLITGGSLSRLDIILDGRHLYVYVVYEKAVLKEGERVVHSSMLQKGFYQTIIETKEGIDEEKVWAERENGLLSIYLPLIASPG